MPAKPIAVAAALVFVSVARAADGVPSPDELQTMFDARQWPELSAAASRVLSLRGPAAGPYDRYDVWMKKGEAQLQANQFTPASQSFGKAADEPKASPEQVDYAKSFADLAKKSDVKGYKTPGRYGPVRVFDVKDPAKRPEAFSALLGVNVAEVTARIDAARQVTERKPLVDLAEAAANLASLDRVVNKSTEQSDATQRRLGENVVAAVKNWADAATAKIEKMKATADEMVEQRVRDRTGVVVVQKVRRGGQPRDLQDSLALVGESRKWADTYTAVKTALGPAGQAAIQPAEAVIQNTFEQAKSVQSDFIRGKPGAANPAQ